MPYRQYEADRIAAGLCLACGDVRDPSGTKVFCRSCADKRNAQKSERLKSGLCAQCGQPRGEGSTKNYCRPCSDSRNVDSSIRQARSMAKGLCRDCGKSRGSAGTTNRCRNCADLKNVSALNRIQAGLCVYCGDIRGEHGTTKSCRLCADKYSIKAGAVRANRILTGLCSRCPALPMNNHALCRKCWLAVILSNYRFTSGQRPIMWDKLAIQQTFLCYYTGLVLVPGANASVDHIIPRSRGGAENDPDNCVWVDLRVNKFKNSLTGDEFIAVCRSVVNHTDLRMSNDQAE